jgi:hypothetical protein
MWQALWDNPDSLATQTVVAARYPERDDFQAQLRMHRYILNHKYAPHASDRQTHLQLHEAIFTHKRRFPDCDLPPPIYFPFRCELLDAAQRVYRLKAFRAPKEWVERAIKAYQDMHSGLKIACVQLKDE